LLSCSIEKKTASIHEAPSRGGSSPINYNNENIKLVGSFDKIAVIVEPREHKGLPLVVRNVLKNLDSSWSVQIFHGVSNKAWIQKEFENEIASRRIFLTKMLVHNLTLQDYNHIMLDVHFWENVLGNHVLLFETDSALCDHSHYKVDDFMQYDYIGAPWSPQFHGSFGCEIFQSKASSEVKYVLSKNDVKNRELFKNNKNLSPVFSTDLSSGIGNSGLSLRNRIKTIEILKEYIPISDLFKSRSNDIFYACILAYPDSHMHAPSFTVASHFSVESIATDSPFGFHKSWDFSTSNEQNLVKACSDYTQVKKNYIEDRNSSFTPR